MKIRMLFALVTTALTGVVGVSAASAQTQSGLVNVAVVDNTVQIPIAVAANVCGVAVNVLAQGTLTSPVDCTAVSGATATAPARGGGGSGGHQSGLVNLYVADNTIQVPIAIAANVCGLTVNALSQFTGSGPASCDATGNATAGP
jgi:hypothetical protein